MTYLTLAQQTRSTGRYPRDLICRVAALSARGERSKAQVEGLTNLSWRFFLSDAMRRCWHVARSARQ